MILNQLHPYRQRTILFLKYILPLIAFFVIALLIIAPLSRALTQPSQTVLAPTVSLQHNGAKGLRIQSTDANKRPFELCAIQGTEVSPGLYELHEPSFRLTLESGQAFFIRSSLAKFDAKDDIVDLFGDVDLRHDQGYHLKTSHVRICLKTMTAWSHSDVSGTSLQGTVAAKGFSLLDQGKKIQLQGQSSLVLNARA